MSDAQGRTIEVPIKSNFKEGLSLLNILFLVMEQEKDWLIRH